MDKELQNIVFNGAYPDRFEQEPFKSVRTVTVGEVVQLVNSRIGQADFSANVRGNYNNRCCFPGCIVADSSFLVGSHIARWADVPELRGEVSNGLCLCLMHDKAFESGYFTISENYTVVVNRLKAEESEWVLANIAPYDGQSIRLGAVLPSDDALLHHWIRTGFYE